MNIKFDEIRTKIMKKGNVMQAVKKAKYGKAIFFFSMLLIAITLTEGCENLNSANNKKIDIQGESLVRAYTISGKLCFDTIRKNSVIVRRTNLSTDSLCKVYTEGKDCVVDYDKGEIARTTKSSILDYSTNPHYGKKEIDHIKFSNYSNHPYFIWVDCSTNSGEQLVKPNDQRKTLVNFRKKLEAVRGTNNWRVTIKECIISKEFSA